MILKTRKAKIIAVVFALAAAVCCCAVSGAAWAALNYSAPDVAAPEFDLVDYLEDAETFDAREFHEGGKYFNWLEDNLDEFTGEMIRRAGPSYEFMGVVTLGDYSIFSYLVPYNGLQYEFNVICKLHPEDGSFEIVYYYWPYGDPGQEQS